MGEVLLCPECGERVRLSGEYAVLNRATASSKDRRLYAHVECAQAWIRRQKGAVGSVDRGMLLRDMLAHTSLSDDALRSLGLQRIRGEQK